MLRKISYIIAGILNVILFSIIICAIAECPIIEYVQNIKSLL
jgi:hypothetical protein